MARNATVPAGNVPFVDANGILTAYGRDLLVQLLKSVSIDPAGSLDLPKTVPAGVGPGTGVLSMQAVAGTTPGTAKIIIYAGNSPTPTTLIDNLGSGF